MDIILYVICVTAVAIAVGEGILAYKRDKHIKQLQNDLISQSKTYKDTIDKHTKELKEHFESKSKLMSDFKVVTDQMREKQDTMKVFYENELLKLKTTYNNELGHRKSSEVRLGKIGESLAPFLNGWPWDPNNFRFIGDPIDGVQFTDDEVLFVEIKTGKSKLNTNQRNIKDLISKKKVAFVTFRIGEDGSSIQRETV